MKLYFLLVCNVFYIELGKLEFVKFSIIVKESSRCVWILVNCINGVDGYVLVVWKIKDIIVISGKDY